jgi:hypothetical protein
MAWQTGPAFECHDVAQVLAERLDATPPALFVDPPRKGLDAGTVGAILAGRPRRLAYLSCDPSTLARDLGRLCADGVYDLSWVQALDLFPNTSHVETLAGCQLRSWALNCFSSACRTFWWAPSTTSSVRVRCRVAGSAGGRPGCSNPSAPPGCPR